MLRNFVRLPRICKLYQQQQRPQHLCRRFSEIKSEPAPPPPTITVPAATSYENSAKPILADAEDLDRKLKILKLEVSVARQEGRKVPDPDLMKPAHWDQLMQLNSRSARTKYYTFLWSTERKKESTQVFCT